MKQLFLGLAAGLMMTTAQAEPTATGDLGLVIERAQGSVLLVDQSDRAALARIEGLGDLSHASLVYSPDERFAYVFGRDGGLTKVDIVTRQIVNRVVQAGNAIGGAISDDGRLVAVSNYEPGGVRVFDAAACVHFNQYFCAATLVICWCIDVRHCRTARVQIKCRAAWRA